MKCTTTCEGKSPEQESLGGADNNISPAVFVTNGASFEAKECRTAAQRTGTQLRCRVGRAKGYCNKALTCVARLPPVPKLLGLQQLSHVHTMRQQ